MKSKRFQKEYEPALGVVPDEWLTLRLGIPRSRVRMARMALGRKPVRGWGYSKRPDNFADIVDFAAGLNSDQSLQDQLPLERSRYVVAKR